MKNFNKEYLNIITESKVILNNIKPIQQIEEVYKTRDNNINGLLFYYFN